MGRNPEWLSDKSLEVLAWIRDGCPAVDQEVGHHRRISAHALARRGLVKVKGHGASWQASITPAGLARLSTPTPAVSRQDRVDRLFRRVVAAGGRFVVDDQEVPMYRDELQRLSERSPDRPRGWRLTMRSHGRYDEERSELVLERYFADDVDEEAVPVPEHVSRYHPTVKTFLSGPGRHVVSREHLARAARILQAIADEAPRRGMDVVGKDEEMRGVGQHVSREIERGHLILRSPAGIHSVRVVEVSAPGDRRVEPRCWSGRGPARRAGFVGTGALAIIVEGPGCGYSGTRYRDAKTITLEEKLPRVFRAIEIHRLEAQAREEERQREAADRQRRWEAAMADARRRYEQQARWVTFAERAREWRAIVEQREFLSAIRAANADRHWPEGDDLVAYLDFVERELDVRDPLMHPELLLPEVPEPKPDDLKPFLDGWSPHGPGSSGW